MGQPWLGRTAVCSLHFMTLLAGWIACKLAKITCSQVRCILPFFILWLSVFSLRHCRCPRPIPHQSLPGRTVGWWQIQPPRTRLHSVGGGAGGHEKAASAMGSRGRREMLKWEDFWSDLCWLIVHSYWHYRRILQFYKISWINGHTLIFIILCKSINL
jgi:hypothetical protein